MDNNQWSGLVRYSHYKKSTSNEQAYINKSQFQEVQPSLILRFKYTLTRLPQCRLLTIFDNICLRVFFRYMGFLITGIDRTVSPEQSCEGYYLQVLRNLTPFWVLHRKNEVPVVCYDVNPKEILCAFRGGTKMWWTSLWPPTVDPEWLPWPLVDRAVVFCGVYFVVITVCYWSSELALYVLWVSQSRRSKGYGRLKFITDILLVKCKTIYLSNMHSNFLFIFIGKNTNLNM